MKSANKATASGSGAGAGSSSSKLPFGKSALGTVKQEEGKSKDREEKVEVRNWHNTNSAARLNAQNDTMEKGIWAESTDCVANSRRNRIRRESSLMTKRKNKRKMRSPANPHLSVNEILPSEYHEFHSYHEVSFDLADLSDPCLIRNRLSPPPKQRNPLAR